MGIHLESISLPQENSSNTPNELTERASLTHQVKQTTQSYFIKIAAAISSIGIFAAAYYFLTRNSTPDLPPRFSSTPNFSRENRCFFTEQPTAAPLFNGTSFLKENRCLFTEQPTAAPLFNGTNLSNAHEAPNPAVPLHNGTNVSTVAKQAAPILERLWQKLDILKQALNDEDELPPTDEELEERLKTPSLQNNPQTIAPPSVMAALDTTESLPIVPVNEQSLFTEQPASPLFYNGTNLSKGNQCPLAERPATEIFSGLANTTLGESQEVSIHPLMKGSEISALLKTTQKKLSDLYTLILNVMNMATQHWPAPLTTSIPLSTTSYPSHGTKTQSLQNRPPFNNAQFQQAINAYNLQARTSLAG